MSTPLTQIDLDIILARGCSNPECAGCEMDEAGLYFNQACHPTAPTQSRYTKEGNRGVIIVECVACESEIAKILVAERFAPRAVFSPK